MCDYCNAELFIKVQQIMRPVLAPLTHADALMDEYINATGTVFVSLQKRFCPVCGRAIMSAEELREELHTSNIEGGL